MARQADSQRRSLKFFKVFDATKYSKQLHIPSAYTSYMQGSLPNRTVLRDSFGNMWPVELGKAGNEWFFQEGWAKVVQENSIEHWDVLVFLFDGEKVFYFTIMGSNSCEKNGVGCLKFLLDEENGVDSGEDGVGCLKFQLDEENGENDQEIIAIKGDAPKSKRPASGSRKLRSEKNVGQEGASSTDGNKKKAKADLYGASIFRSGERAQPKNPYFVTKIRKERQNTLFIPSEVIKDFRLNLPPKMILRDPHGRTWPSNLKKWKDGRALYIGGWDSLCKVNFIDEEDDCVCEFVPGRGRGKPVMQIQIVRN